MREMFPASRASGLLLMAALVLAALLPPAPSVGPAGPPPHFSTNASAVFPSNTAVPRTAATTLASGGFDNLVLDPFRDRLYVADASNGTVLVWNTTRDAAAAWVSVGAGPNGMDVSANGTELYVALTRGSSLVVVNLTTLTYVATIPLTSPPWDVAAGRPGRAYVTLNVTGFPIIVDTDARREIGNITSGSYLYARALAKSSFDRTTLYIGQPGISPAELCKFSITSESVPIIVCVPFNRIAGFLVDMQLIANATKIFAACQPSYPNCSVLGLYTSNFSVAVNFQTGGNTDSVALDGRLWYAFGANDTRTVEAFNATTGANIINLVYTQNVSLIRSVTNGSKVYAITAGSSNRLEVASTGLPPSPLEPPYVSTRSNTTSGQVPLSVTFAGSATLGSRPYNFTWTFGDGSTSYRVETTHVYATPGAYTPTLVVRDALGVTGSSNLSIYAAPVPPPVITSASASVSWGFAPLSVFFNAAVSSGVPPYNFTWTFGDGGTAYVEDLVHVYTVAASYTATFTVRDSRGLGVSRNLRVTVAVPLLPDPLAETRSLYGLAYNLSTNNWVPPDPQVAVNSNYIVEIVNSRLSIWARSSGAQLTNVTSTAFFGTATNQYLTDPKIQYDVPTGRWFASVGDFTSNAIRLLVSKSSDPTGPWFATVIATPSSECPDQPILGVGTLAIVVSANLFANCQSTSISYVGAEYWVVNKTDLLAGAPPRMASMGPYSTEHSVHPVQELTPSPTMYLVSVGLALVPTDTLELITISGVPPYPIAAEITSLPIRTVNQPPNVPQLGSSLRVNTGDARVLDAFLDGRNLWVSFGDACHPAGSSVNQSCARILEVNVTARRVAQDFDIGDPAYGVFYPAIRPDSAGNLIATFGYASDSSFPGIMATVRLETDPANTYRAPIVLAFGSGPEALLCDTSSCRYGDYFGAAIDPLDPQAVWLSGEFGTGGGWSTLIAEVRLFRTAKVTVTYAFVGGGAGAPPPALTYFASGVRVTTSLPANSTTLDVDIGTGWSISANLSSANRLERWINVGRAIGNITGDAILNLEFQHQYFVTITKNSFGGGTVQPGLGWYDSGATVNLTATAATGWKFMGWTGSGRGSYNGTEDPHSLVIEGAVVENAVFDAGVTISVSAFGSVTYAYENRSGTVPGGTTITLFVPLGTLVYLNATASVFSQFVSWSGNVSGTSSSASIRVAQPSSVTANYTISLAGIYLVLGLPSAILAAVLALLLIRRRRKKTAPILPPVASPHVPSASALVSVPPKSGQVPC